ncbi:tetratricopeptide repeat protein [Clostridium sp. 19966]|uniref:tetratricopeptide repeat protein n=1 Tax=Clostridium sp. 19966 TaxID=2768166 RepID=UPI0028DF0AA7|nr:tetratricopeptide repeat protein [Clostridium sp. 19966]MDT8717258.1 tetratricopeptide repeat protein [Clostridium sp. 19966]
MNKFPEMDADIKVIFLYNRSLYYNCLKEYNKAVEHIDELINIVDKNSNLEYTRILLLKASCLYNLNNYDEALRIYEELLKITLDNDYGNKALYYNNLVEIYLDMKKKDMANKNLNEVLELIPKVSEDFYSLPHLYLEIGRRYIKLENKKSAIIFLHQSLNLAKKFKYSFIITDALMELTNISEENIDVDIKDEFLDLVYVYGEVNNMLLINILQYFARLNDNNTIEYICNSCKSYLKNI